MADSSNAVDWDNSDPRPKCKFGPDCYRNSKQHLKDYQHPKRPSNQKDDRPKKKAKIEDFFTKSNKEKKAKETDVSESGYVRSSEKEPGEAEPMQKTEENTSKSETFSSTTKKKTKGNKTSSIVSEVIDDVKGFIKSKYLVDMPNDFFQFWEFCKSLNASNASEALMDSLGYHLVGPFDVLADKCKKTNKYGEEPCYHRHWRYYYDPPEFMTVIRGDDESQFHLGYLRDDPKDLPVFVASNAAKNNGAITPRGENLFAAIKAMIDDTLKKEKNSSVKKKLGSLREKLVAWADAKNIYLQQKTSGTKARDKKVVCKTFHGAGIVVPVDDNDVGYREVPESPADLKKMFKKIVESKTAEDRDKNMEGLQELITLVQFANDECDYGEGLELGLDLFTYGGEVFHPMILMLLPMAYQLLSRFEYADIIQTHLADRKHTADLSEFG